MRHCSRQRISCVNSKQTFIVSNDTHFLTILQIYPRIILPQWYQVYLITFQESQDKCGSSAYHAKEYTWTMVKSGILQIINR